LKIGKPRSTKGLATFCAKIAQEKIASNILLMDMEIIETAPADYFVIATCDSDMQMRAIIDLLKDVSRELGMSKPKIEGMENMQWVLIDYFDVVMHLMLPEVREYYHLEKLWGDAKFMQLNESGNVVAYRRKVQ
jgi:ribosome-associated protein